MYTKSVSVNILSQVSAPALDVVGALGAGMQTVWVNRSEHLWTQGQHPHATVADLAELCDLLGRTSQD
jgi:FMN phosphatase YigB (HAD superfamily)